MDLPREAQQLGRRTAAAAARGPERSEPFTSPRLVPDKVQVLLELVEADDTPADAAKPLKTAGAGLPSFQRGGARKIGASIAETLASHRIVR